jgi:hypothetical protein
MTKKISYKAKIGNHSFKEFIEEKEKIILSDPE